MEEKIIKETVKLNLYDLPYKLRVDWKDNSYRETQMDLKSFVNAPITTHLTRKDTMEEMCFYAPDVIGVILNMTNNCLEVDITIAIYPAFEYIWSNSKKKFTIEYIDRNNKILVSSLYLEE